MTVDGLRDLEEGDLVHSERTNDVYRVTQIEAEFDEDNIPHGTVHFNDGTAITTEDAEDVDYRLHDAVLTVVDPEIVENSGDILLSFAQKELKQYASRVGFNHDYNGVEHVDTLRDLKVAELLHTRGIPPKSN